jgi:hypothetical protein
MQFDSHNVALVAEVNPRSCHEGAIAARNSAQSRLRPPRAMQDASTEFESSRAPTRLRDRSVAWPRGRVTVGGKPSYFGRGPYW